MKGRIAGDVQDYLLNFCLHDTASHQSTTAGAHLEIGVLFGGSLILAMHAVAGTEDTVIGIDPLEGYYGRSLYDPESGVPVIPRIVRGNIRKCGPKGVKWSLFQNYSQNVAESIKVPLKVLFIDGDHSYEGVKSDWDLYSPKVVRGGCVLIDNYGDPNWPDVGRFVDTELPPAGWSIICKLGRSVVLRRD